VIAANLALGGSANALALARYAVNPANPSSMRGLALATLADFSQPPPREPVFGFHRGWPQRPPERLHAALDLLVPALVGTEYEGRALEIARDYGRVPFSDEDLLDRVESWFEPIDLKVASLRVLAERRSPLLSPAIDSALESRRPELRVEARDALVGLRAEAAVASVAALSAGAPQLERQRAFATLAAAATPAADVMLRENLLRLQRDELDPALALDLVEAAEARGPALAPGLLAYRESLRPGDLVAGRRIALMGGESERGRRVFEGPGDCQRCHGAGAAGGQGRAGPDLAGIGRRRDRESLLRSLVDPQAEIAPGFGVVRVELEGGEIIEGSLVEEGADAITLERGGDRIQLARTEVRGVSLASSPMPAMGLVLSLPQLRDLIEYLATR